MTKQTKYLSLAGILTFTVTLYLWPDLHPERAVVDQHFWWMDLIMHGGYFLVATFLLLLIPLQKSPVIIALIFFTLSVGLELLQYFSYNRTMDIVDVASNLLGVILAVGIYKLTIKTTKNP